MIPNQPVLKMSSKLYPVFMHPSHRNPYRNQLLSRWVNQWDNLRKNQMIMYYLVMHQSSVQKIPGIIKWNSPIIYATP